VSVLVDILENFITVLKHDEEIFIKILNLYEHVISNLYLKLISLF